jgi:hypothetical protein
VEERRDLLRADLLGLPAPQRPAGEELLGLAQRLALEARKLAEITPALGEPQAEAPTLPPGTVRLHDAVSSRLLEVAAAVDEARTAVASPLPDQRAMSEALLRLREEIDRFRSALPTGGD